MNLTLKVLAGFGTILLAWLAFYFSTYPELGPVRGAAWKAPTANPADSVTYEAAIHRSGADLEFLFEWRVQYAVHIYRTGSSSYYFSADYGWLGLTEEQIRQTKVVWTDAGLRLKDPSGAETFFPSTIYDGGR